MARAEGKETFMKIRLLVVPLSDGATAIALSIAAKRL
jgi:hypothetical protein